jgi:hypothetical protein
MPPGIVLSTVQTTSRISMALQRVLLTLLLAAGVSALSLPAQACQNPLHGHSGADASAAKAP